MSKKTLIMESRKAKLKNKNPANLLRGRQRQATLWALLGIAHGPHCQTAAAWWIPYQLLLATPGYPPKQALPVFPSFSPLHGSFKASVGELDCSHRMQEIGQKDA
jgi:hypothetical protein